MSQLIPFQFNTTSIRVITTDDGETLFVAKDVAEALGYADTKRTITLNCKKSKLANEVKGGVNNTLHPQTKLIPESDVYRLAMKSELPTAEPFQDWLADEVLPSIRKTGSYAHNQQAQLPSFADAVAGVEAVANYLRLSESGRIAFIKPVIEQYGVAIQLPVYAVDAPPSLSTESSMPTKSVTALLREHGSNYGFSAVAFNKHLESLGLVETLMRKSLKGEKQYKSVTTKGLEFGKNLTSPNNPKETQPHWYIHRFSELFDLVIDGLQ